MWRALELNRDDIVEKAVVHFFLKHQLSTVE